MLKQLDDDTDNNIEPSGKEGARGAMFKISLAASGYTVLGEGTVKAFVPWLQREAKFYQHLEHAQGEFAPVYLGSVQLPYGGLLPLCGGRYHALDPPLVGG